MTRTESRTTTISCQAKDCPNTAQLAGAETPEDKGWGSLSMKLGPDGYSEVDLCQQHFRRVADLFGLAAP